MTTTTGLHELSVAEAAERIATKELSPVELIDALLARIEALDPKLKAFVTVTAELARKQAQAAERDIMRSGPRSAIHGVPYGLKDIIDTAGIPTEAGSKVFAGRVPDTNAHVVDLLEGAGAVLLGKTVTTEFADGHPSPSVNPWNAEHTPAGSSAGSSVAVAARLLPAALGTQTVGSVLRPAAYTGVVGFKPTFGRIGRTGVIPHSLSCDHVGILVRTVKDAALFLSALAGYDPDDDGSLELEAPDFVAALDQLQGAPRIGFARAYFLDESEEVTRADVLRVAGLLGEAGATVEDVDIGIDFADGYRAHTVVQRAELAEWHEPLYKANPSLYQATTIENIEDGYRHSAIDFVRANGVRQQMRDAATAAMAPYDVLMMPTASGPAPHDITRTGDTRFQSPWSFTGLPSITLPTGLAPNGLPTAVQLVGKRFDEGRLLAAAQWVERTLAVQQAPPVG